MRSRPPAPRALLLAALVAVLALALPAAPVHAVIEPPPGLNYAFIQMQFVEISKIDGVEQAFRADFYMKTSWVVDLDPATTNVTTSDQLESGTIGTLMWQPLLEFINARDETTRLVEEPFSFALDGPDFALNGSKILFPDPAFVAKSPNDQAPLIEFKPSGVNPVWVVEDQRYQCDFTTSLNMRNFPFDRQYMELLVESFWDVERLQIVWAQPERINALLPFKPLAPGEDPAKRERIDIVGWRYSDAGYFNKLQHYAYNNADYARLVLRVSLERLPEYYLTKIVAGSMLLVYMCIWVFSLAVDEADRMMGTLTVFGGLVTFLFVANGDTPKVPYQTRLDMFFLYSFMCVATMLVVHGALYYWRECDVEEFLEEKHEGRFQGNGAVPEKEEQRGRRPSAALQQQHKDEQVSPRAVASPSAVDATASNGKARVFVNATPEDWTGHNGAPAAAAASPGAQPAEQPHDFWYLRKSPSSEWSLQRWWRGLHLTRKCDAVIIPVMTLVYTIGAAVILSPHRTSLQVDTEF